MTDIAKPHSMNKMIILISIVLVAAIGGGVGYLVMVNKPDLSQFDVVRGEQIYNSVCIACHLPGQFGAPKVGNHADWSPRLAKGLDSLFISSINGLNDMPPRGGHASLSDDEVKNAVAFMISKSWW